MISTRKAIIIVFILVTIVSAFLISYNIYLTFDAYNITRLMKASISEIEVTYSGDEASLNMHFLLNNSSNVDVELVYAAAFVYLNGQALTPNYAPATLIIYSTPIQLPPFSSVPVLIRLENVPGDKVPLNSSRQWFIKLQFIVSDVPLVGREAYTFYLQRTETGS